LILNSCNCRLLRRSVVVLAKMKNGNLYKENLDLLLIGYLFVQIMAKTERASDEIEKS